MKTRRRPVSNGVQIHKVDALAQVVVVVVEEAMEAVVIRAEASMLTTPHGRNLKMVNVEFAKLIMCGCATAKIAVGTRPTQVDFIIVWRAIKRPSPYLNLIHRVLQLLRQM